MADPVDQVTITDSYAEFQGGQTGGTYFRTVVGVPTTISGPSAEVTFSGVGDLDAAGIEYFDIFVEGTYIGRIQGQQYGSPVSVFASIPESVWAAVIADGMIEMTYVVGPESNDFGSEYINASFTWLAGPAVVTPPVAVADTVVVAEGATLAAAARIDGVLGNDTDADDGQTASLVVTSIAAGVQIATAVAGSPVTVTGAYGVLTINADGTYSYNANNAQSLNVGQTAVDTFTYGIEDEDGETSTATLAITINGVANTIAGATPGVDKLTGTAFDDLLFGLGGADVLTAGAGNDRLDGGIGIDRMVGGTGGDTYVVDDIRDAVIELAGEGIDTVESSVDYTLAANVENLTFTGSAIKGTGNALANTLTGNAQNNVLNGADGDDIIFGLAGFDNLTGGNGADQIHGGDDADTLTGVAGDDTLWGDGGDDVLSGGEGDDTGYGGDGADQFLGAAGNDVFSGGDGADLAYGGAGTDQLFGDAGADRLLGEAGDDVLFGGESDDVLTGGSGSDSLQGGLGADTFVYLSTADSTGLGRDVIQDFNVAQGDRINLQAIDAKSGTATNDDFTLVASLTGVAGQLAITHMGAGLYELNGDVNGDGQADFGLLFISATPMSLSDLTAITGVKTIALGAIPDLFA